MEFSYWVSEAEYFSAWRASRKDSFRLIRLFIWFMLFWLSLLLLDLALWFVTYYTSPHSPVQHPLAMFPAKSLVGNALPFCSLLCAWIYLLLGFTPMRIRRQYRRDPSMRGQFAVSMTPESISISNTAGVSSRSAWNIYKGWREGKNVIVLLPHAGPFVILSLAGMAEPQRQELRRILAAALPKK